jgi:hypothetical protein
MRGKRRESRTFPALVSDTSLRSYLLDDFFRDDVFRRDDRLDDDLRGGTFAPSLRASDRPIAIACFRLVTRPPCPFLPRRSVPFLRRRIALSTSFCARGPYFLPLDLRVDFRLVAICALPR